MNKIAIQRKFLFAGIIAILVSLPFILPSLYWVSVSINIGITVLLVTSLRFISLVGYYSLGHIAFMLIGAYTSALLVMKAGISFWIAFIIAGLSSAIIALSVAYPFLKVKGVYFAILTLLTAETFRLVAWNWKSLTGGEYGLINIPPPGSIPMPGIAAINFSSFTAYYYLMLILVGVSIFVLHWIEKSRAGFIWKAIREADSLARCVGINTMKYKIMNFVVGSFFAGIAGALYAHFENQISVDYTSNFGIFTSIYLIVYLVVGGPAKLYGPILGTAILMIASEFARPLKENQTIIVGLLTIFIVLYVPEGIIGIPERVKLAAKGFGKKKLLNAQK